MSYEDVLNALKALEPSQSEAERNVTWLGTSTTVGVSRTVDGRIEIFLAGSPVQSIHPKLAHSLIRGTWHRAGGQAAVEATRLLLPTAAHFTQVAAFICTELLRNGADGDLPSAFQRSEALINHSIEGLSMNAQVLVGLKGELLLLQALIQSRGSDDLKQLIGMWHGWRRSTRDFAVGSTGVEVKTTTGSTSVHEIQGLHQVETSVSPSPEQCLLLVSIGIENTTPENPSAFTLPQIVGTILGRTQAALPPAEADPLCAEFLMHVKDYGSEQGVGYDHNTMSDDSSFTQPFVLQWVRGYDMGDTDIKILRSPSLTPYPHVSATSVRFSISLPPQINGDFNPTNGLSAVANQILGASEGLK